MKDATDSTPVALACAASADHFDELRGTTASAVEQSDTIAINLIAKNSYTTGSWGQFFEFLASDCGDDMDQRAAALERQIRDDGVTYNVYAAENGPSRPWSLNLFPLIIEPGNWQQIEAGVMQRMRLLERIMADVYGSQQLLAHGLLPPALVQGHPGYLRAMHGVSPVGGTHLHIAAFDLARGPQGNWSVIGQRCQAPSGLGYLLENRLAISAQFPQAFESLRVQRLASTYRALVDGLKQMSPAGADSHLALLTPGPYNETYFEHAYLARYLGLTLVEGSDLIVRDERLYLKTLEGLIQVHGLLKRVDDQYLDPLELRPDSTLGVPGLLQVIRAGNVLVANAPGSAFLESPALLAFLPLLSQHLLSEKLLLPAVPTWWCGERSDREAVLPQLRDCVIKPTYPGSPIHHSFDAVLGCTLSPSELDGWRGRMVRQSDEHTVQAYVPLSQMPTWRSTEQSTGIPTSNGQPAMSGRVVPRSVMLRVFAVADGRQSWRVLPGGLARVAGTAAEMASMQRGGSSADVWALTQGEVDKTTLLQRHMTPAPLTQRKRLVTSRAAENLYWLGRYTERTQNAIRLARLTLEWLNGDAPTSTPLLAWLSSMAVANTLVLPGVPSAFQAHPDFERSLISSLGSTEGATSVGYNLRALKMAASTVRERLSPDHWRAIVRVEEELFALCAQQARRGGSSSLQALQILKSTGDHMAAISGAQIDSMTHDDGWRLLSIGRHIERLGFLASSLGRGLVTGSVHTDDGFEAMFSLFDSTLTLHTQYPQSRAFATLIDLLVLDRDNPRSLAWVAHTLRMKLDKLAGDAPADAPGALSLQVPDPALWSRTQLCGALPAYATPGAAPETVSGSSFDFPALSDLLGQCVSAAFKVSNEISLTYFTRSIETNQSVGT